MNPTELKTLADTLNGIADGKPWQSGDDTNGWHDCPTGELMSTLRLVIGGMRIRLKPWELTDTVNGHTLPPGASWHRQDFTEDMLPAPYRPIMFGEDRGGDDEVFGLFNKGPWRNSQFNDSEVGPQHNLSRTTRPIPFTLTPAQIADGWLPLGPEDVPPFSLIRRKGQTDEYGKPQYWHWRLISYVTGIGPVCADRGYNWQELSTDYEINRPRHRDADGNPTLWEPCRKPSRL